MKKVFVIIFIIFAFAIPVNAGLVFNLSFGTYTLGATNFTDTASPRLWNPVSGSGPDHSYTVVSTPTARVGSNSMKFYLEPKESPKVVKSMFYLDNPADGTTYKFQYGSEYWFAFSVYLPNDFVQEDSDTKWDIIWQLHGVPDSGEGGRNPCMAMFINQDHYRFFVRGDSRLNQGNPATYTGDTLSTNIGTWKGDTGKWVDWVVHFVPDYTDDNSMGGFTELYKNGVIVDINPGHSTTYRGQNAYNDAVAPYITYGVYKYHGAIRAIYFDAIKLGDTNSNLSEVSPTYQQRSVTTQALSAPTNLKIVPTQ